VASPSHVQLGFGTAERTNSVCFIASIHRLLLRGGRKKVCIISPMALTRFDGEVTAAATAAAGVRTIRTANLIDVAFE